MKPTNIYLKQLCAALFLLPGLTGCTHDDTEVLPPGGQQQYVTVEIAVPDFHRPVTRSIEEDGGEAVVKTVDLLIFDKTTVPKLLHHVAADIVRQSGSGPDYKVSFDVLLPKLDNAGMVAAIANASDAVATIVGENPPGSSKTAIMEALKFASQPDAVGTYKWNVSTPGYTPIPMYGETTVNGITPGMKIANLQFVRMLARIDVENKVAGSIFQLQEIYLVNYRTEGYIAPAWNSTSGIVLKKGEPGYPYSSNGDPMIPSTAGKPENTKSAAMQYVYVQTSAPGPLLSGEIYTYEAVKGDVPADDPAKRVCLVLKGTYKSAEYYYRVDFTTNKGGSLEAPEVENMPLYRNHKYIVNITAVEGIGYGSFDEAIRASSVLSNLKTSILVVDMSGIKEIVYDGQYFMGVESRTIESPWGANKQRNLRISSDYEGDWKAEVLDPNGTKWLRLAGNQTTSSGTDINVSGLDFIVTALSSPGTGPNYVSGKIIVTAGRLRDTLTVRRVPIANLFARSNVVEDSGSLTFAVTAEDNQRIAAWSQGVFFKWGSLLALTPVGNPYDPTSHLIYYPPGFYPPTWGGGLAGWDKIPYAHSNFGFVTPSLTGDDMDAFESYANNKGYDEDKGVGDVCRYISAKAGWIEGNWRMPTYAEMEMLYNETNVKTARIGDFKNITATFNGLPTGMSDPLSGWFLGANVTSSTSSNANNKTSPPDGTAYLPTGGHRYPNGDGNVVHIGAYGYYWSSTPYVDYTVNYLFQTKSGVEFYDADRSYAFPVRCIREY